MRKIESLPIDPSIINKEERTSVSKEDNECGLSFEQCLTKKNNPKSGDENEKNLKPHKTKAEKSSPEEKVTEETKLVDSEEKPDEKMETAAQYFIPQIPVPQVTPVVAVSIEVNNTLPSEPGDSVTDPLTDNALPLMTPVLITTPACEKEGMDPGKKALIETPRSNISLPTPENNSLPPPLEQPGLEKITEQLSTPLVDMAQHPISTTASPATSAFDSKKIVLSNENEQRLKQEIFTRIDDSLAPQESLDSIQVVEAKDLKGEGRLHGMLHAKNVSVPKTSVPEPLILEIMEENTVSAGQSSNDKGATVVLPVREEHFSQGEQHRQNGLARGREFELAPGLVMQQNGSSVIPAAFPIQESPLATKAEQVLAVVRDAFETPVKMSADGRNNVELNLKLEDGEKVTIKLKWEDGHVKIVFKTDSSTLRSALEQNWAQFSDRSIERGLRVTAPTFENFQPKTDTGDLGQKQNHQEQAADPWRDKSFESAWRGPHGPRVLPQPGTRNKVTGSEYNSKPATALEAWA